jgi:hypothetical protein
MRRVRWQLDGSSVVRTGFFLAADYAFGQALVKGTIGRDQG